MNTGMKLEVHYHQQNEASIYLESSMSGKEERLAETLLFALYAFRHLANLEESESAKSLATLLYQTYPETLDLLAQGNDSSELKLVPYAGSPGRKRFEAQLHLNDSNIKFKLNNYGFGLLGRGIEYYSPSSVIALLRYLAQKRSADSRQLAALAKTAEICGQFALEGRLTITSQHSLAITVNDAVGHYMVGLGDLFGPGIYNDPISKILYDLTGCIYSCSWAYVQVLIDPPDDWDPGLVAAIRDYYDGIFCEFLVGFLSVMHRFIFDALNDVEDNAEKIVTFLNDAVLEMTLDMLDYDEGSTKYNDFSAQFMNTYNERINEYTEHKLFREDGDEHFGGVLGFELGINISKVIGYENDPLTSLISSQLFSKGISELVPHIKQIDKIRELLT